MPCILTTGFSLSQDCRQGKGGIQKVFITELSNKETLVVSGGVVTTFTLASGKKFFQYDLRKGSSSAKSSFQGEIATGSASYKHRTDLQMSKRETVKRNEIQLLAQNSTLQIVLDENGKYWLFGAERGMDMVAGDTSMTGTAATDMNGYTMGFESDELEMEVEVPAAIVAALIV